MRAVALSSFAKPVIAVVFCLLGSSAYAQTTAFYPDGNQPPGSPSNIQLSVPVTASVAEQCGFAPNGAPDDTYNAGDIRNGWTHDTAFTLECNGPLNMAVTSLNGGLLASGTPASGYANLEVYSVTLHIAGDSGSAEATCTTDLLLHTLGSSSCGFYGTASTSVGLNLNGSSEDQSGSYIRISNGTGYTGSQTLIASNTYTDTLTVTLSPQ